jgi:hypothetical protein
LPIITEFIEECCFLDEKSFLSASDLLDAIYAYASEVNDDIKKEIKGFSKEKLLSTFKTVLQRVFNQDVKISRYTKRNSPRVRGIEGINVIECGETINNLKKLSRIVTSPAAASNPFLSDGFVPWHESNIQQIAEVQNKILEHRRIKQSL